MASSTVGVKPGGVSWMAQTSSEKVTVSDGSSTDHAPMRLSRPAMRAKRLTPLCLLLGEPAFGDVDVQHHRAGPPVVANRRHHEVEPAPLRDGMTWILEGELPHLPPQYPADPGGGGLRLLRTNPRGGARTRRGSSVPLRNQDPAAAVAVLGCRHDSFTARMTPSGSMQRDMGRQGVQDGGLCLGGLPHGALAGAQLFLGLTGEADAGRGVQLPAAGDVQLLCHERNS